MHVATLIHGIGSIGIFSSRAFLPAFITALLIRIGPQFELLADSWLLRDLESVPSWFTHPVTITILGLLSALEIAATKSPDARQLLAEIDPYLKTGVAIATYLGVLSATDRQIVTQIQQAGFVEYLLLVVIGGGVLFVSRTRQAVASVLVDADEDDETGIQQLISWFEDLWATVGLLLLVLFPFVMLALIALASGILVLLRKRAEWREERSKIACAQCGEMIYPSATACAKCRAPVSEPCRVGFLGQSKPEPTLDPDRHPYRLVEKKRCPVCATRFGERRVHQTCQVCGHELMSDPAFVQAYMAYVGARYPKVLVVSLLLSLVPVIGLIPGVIYYRMALVAPFSRYLPLGRRFLIKWTIRLLFLVLIACQWIPVAGGVVLPLMATISYLSYRSSFRGLAEQGAA
ncbi:MAG: hypothetical protein CMJ18_10355 [Phycisphaeraceae bacterium]|nr:hypothetical protein [Phycisphaeraceae bacterium]